MMNGQITEIYLFEMKNARIMINVRNGVIFIEESAAVPLVAAA
jgi:flagellar basal body P-ring protein FlgI